MKIEYLDLASSTNDYIRRYLPLGEDVIVCAKEQSAGRGTKGRSFLSERGGVYLSALTFYRDVPASDAFRVMMHAAVAVCKTAEAFSVTPEIKWPNDILVSGKKLCGILIENIVEENRLRASIVGIGLNVSNDVSPLHGIAVTLGENNPSLTAEEVRDVLIAELQKRSSVSDYQRYVRTGETVQIEEGGRTYSALVRAVREDGRLEIEENGRVRLLASAEIGRIE